MVCVQCTCVTVNSHFCRTKTKINNKTVTYKVLASLEFVFDFIYPC